EKAGASWKPCKASNGTTSTDACGDSVGFRENRHTAIVDRRISVAVPAPTQPHLAESLPNRAFAEGGASPSVDEAEGKWWAELVSRSRRLRSARISEACW